MFGISPFLPEGWMSRVAPSALPRSRASLALLPTPVHRLGWPEEVDVELYIKRDDLTSFELSGNKIRKLEFLLADAIENGYDSVVTTGGLQSNHCRATAVACRQLGLEPYLILRTDKDPATVDLTGNLMLSRMVGAHVRTVTAAEYRAKGSAALVNAFAEEIRINEGRKCYPIITGGSNALGTFGYINAITELLETSQTAEGIFPFDHIVFACGSGGTAAGLAIGTHLAGLDVKLHAVGVCDSPDEFYDIICCIANELGLKNTESNAPLTREDVKGWITIYDGQGEGYAVSTAEELAFLHDISRKTGLVFDPVYSGKAIYKLAELLKVQKELPSSERVIRANEKVLFIHTGGTLGLYDKSVQLLQIISGRCDGTVSKMCV